MTAKLSFVLGMAASIVAGALAAQTLPPGLSAGGINGTVGGGPAAGAIGGPPYPAPPPVGGASAPILSGGSAGATPASAMAPSPGLRTPVIRLSNRIGARTLYPRPRARQPPARLQRVPRRR